MSATTDGEVRQWQVTALERRIELLDDQVRHAEQRRLDAELARARDIREQSLWTAVMVLITALLVIALVVGVAGRFDNRVDRLEDLHPSTAN